MFDGLFFFWLGQTVLMKERCLLVSRDRDSGRAKQVSLCSTVRFSLGLEEMLMGQYLIGSGEGLGLGQGGGEGPRQSRASL